MAFSEKFEDALLLVAEKVDGNQYLTAIKNAVYRVHAVHHRRLVCHVVQHADLFHQHRLAALIPAAASLKSAFTAINFATMSFMTIQSYS